MSQLLRQADDKFDRVNEQQTRRVVDGRISDQEAINQRKTTSRGGLALDEGSITLVNGTNNNVSLDYATHIRITGPTAAFTITGFKNGEKGAIYFLRNATNYSMTLANSSASSSTNNRIYTQTGTDLVLNGGAGGVCIIFYDTVFLKWIAMPGVQGLHFDPLYLKSGSYIDYGDGAVRLTHATDPFSAANGLTLTTATAFSGLTVTGTDPGIGGPVVNLFQDSASPAVGDQVGALTFGGKNSSNAAKYYGYITGVIDDATAGSEDGTIRIHTMTAGATAANFKFTSNVFTPNANDGSALGTTALMWSDLFLASGGVINFNNGDVTVTHSSNTLAFAGAASGYTFDNNVVVASTGLVVSGAGSCAFELGRIDGSSSTPFIDFHSGATAVDYDARIVASGGTGSIGGGDLLIKASTTSVQPLANATHATQNTAAFMVSSAAGSTDQYTIGYNGTDWQLQTWNTKTLQINLQGNKVKFGGAGTTASAANAFLDNADGNNLLRSTSSLIYKRDVETMTPGTGDAILQMRPIWYRSKCAADNPTWSYWGFAAEEMAQIDPRLVFWSYQDDSYDITEYTDEGGNPMRDKVLRKDARLVPDAVMYDRITVFLADLVQRHEARIRALEATQGPPS